MIISATNASVTIAQSTNIQLGQITLNTSTLIVDYVTFGTTSVSRGIIGQDSNITLKNSEVGVDEMLLDVNGGNVKVDTVRVRGHSRISYFQMVKARSADCTFVNSSFIGDFASSQAGLQFKSCTVRMDGVNISQMYSPDGGGGLDIETSTITLRKCVLSMNQGLAGGAIAASSSTIVIEYCTFDANRCIGRSNGGGCHFLGCTTSVSNSLFSNNNGYFGGAFGTRSNNLADSRIHKFHLTDYDLFSDSELEIDNCTFINNHASTGGALYLSDSIKLTSCTVSIISIFNSSASCPRRLSRFFNNL